VRRVIRLRSSILLTCLVAACTPVGRAPAPSPNPAAAGPGPSQQESLEHFSGTLVIEGRSHRAALDLTERRGDASSARLELPALGLLATGQGSADQDRISFRLTYAGECAGSARLDARRQDEGTTLVGTVEAEDCTGRVVGQLRLARLPQR